MQLGDMLVARGLVTPADIEEALTRQVKEGGRIRRKPDRDGRW